ncbi:PREDICTED: uncharacterized protein At3g17950-like [Fragaria vesca subsp. vesca]|uniref:uncharacterized protein At3g17950-like n=1 Tax=Fragaria vesca subsp. vesca TaxID=101020 RepID=UPI0002C374FC|nr:PREDICTED: uncharacterized protein At3g17950-like [Fragaria vesca subsp. vesca]
MVTEDHEMHHGWPLGLEIMSLRLGLGESLPADVTRHHVPSTSFTSFSSSNLDTESTASFFQDHSMSLGRLIGIRANDRGRLYYSNPTRFDEHDRVSLKASSRNSDVSRRHQVDMSRRICLPLLLGALVKISRSKNKSKKPKFEGKH